MRKDETLKADLKRQLIERFLNDLMNDSPRFYYSPAAEIAREIYRDIREALNRLPVEEQALLRKLTVRDIEVILSIKP